MCSFPYEVKKANRLLRLGSIPKSLALAATGWTKWVNPTWHSGDLLTSLIMSCITIDTVVGVRVKMKDMFYIFTAENEMSFYEYLSSTHRDCDNLSTCYLETMTY